MEIFVQLVQYNNTKEKKVTFEASKVVNYADKTAKYNVAKQLAKFSKEVLIHTEKLKKLGLNSTLIKKSQPVEITLESKKGDYSISFKNFGRFVNESSEKVLTEAMLIKFKLAEILADMDAA